jgi:hypothetical protein
MFSLECGGFPPPSEERNFQDKLKRAFSLKSKIKNQQSEIINRQCLVSGSELLF